MRFFYIREDEEHGLSVCLYKIKRYWYCTIILEEQDNFNLFSDSGKTILEAEDNAFLKMKKKFDSTWIMSKSLLFDIKDEIEYNKYLDKEI